MRSNLIGVLAALALGGCTGAALGGCGSSETKTVSVAGSPEVTHSTPTTRTPSTRSSPATTATGTSPAPTATAGGTVAPTSTTHTAPEPEFTHQESHTEGLGEAVSVLQSRGYTPNETAQYHPNQTLQVLVGTKTGSSDGYDQQAFFFLNGRYIGTDTKEASATVKVLAQSDTEVTLGYPLYRKGDPLSNPSGGQATVRFQLDDGKLTPLDPIPPASSANAPGRL